MITSVSLKAFIRKVHAVAARCKLFLIWTPVYLRFQMRGHGQSWRIFTHMTAYERLLLYRLGLQQPAGAVMLEIGSYLGASASFLGAAAQEIGGDARVHCVDTWHNEGMTEGPLDTWEEFQANIKPYASLIIPHRGRSANVADAFKEQLDLLFIDGDHSYESCRADVLAWLPHLKDSSIIVIHDYGWAEGVQRVIKESVRPYAKREGRLPNMYWAWL